jgi:chorismate synthase
MFRITTFGESHGGAVGVVVDGCPAGLELTESDIQPELDRRRPGQSKITTPRNEADQISLLSGVFEGKTTGTPILIMAQNKDMRPQDYTKLHQSYRPSHADYTYDAKYGFRDWRGSGRASARETLARVAAGAIAKKFLAERGIEFLSYVEQVGTLRTSIPFEKVTADMVESNIVRCPDTSIAKEMIDLIDSVRDDGDSIGGVIRAVIRGVPAGLGEPVFDKISSDLGAAMLSINAVKGFEIGSGFDGVALRGSEHNDPYGLNAVGETIALSNRAGGTLGGISSGQDIYFRVAFKPVATIQKSQKTVTLDGRETELAASGRHDPCVLPRAVPIVDAMAALVVMDHFLRQQAYASL